MKSIYFTVTNDLVYDQRMIRICNSLAENGYAVTLIGRNKKSSPPLQQKNFKQHRLNCFFEKGFAFYLEYNLRLLFYLLGRKADAICAIDLDTILPVLLTTSLKKSKRIYDAHEYFTEMKEVHSRKMVRRVWLTVEKFAVPRFRLGYTVSSGLSEKFRQNYGVNYLVIRNLPLLRDLPQKALPGSYLLYQGAVNEGRGFEFLIPAMRKINARLVIVGDGNFMSQLKDLISKNGVEAKTELKGMVLPEELPQFSRDAILGFGLSDREGANQFHALPNKFFDYIHGLVPQMVMNFPEYQKVNDEYKVAVLIDESDPDHIAEEVNRLIGDEARLQAMQKECEKARLKYCWQEEEKTLLAFYQQIWKRHE